MQLRKLQDYFPVSGFFSVGETVVTATAIDPMMNSDECTFLVTVMDDENPVADCPEEDLIVNTDPGSCVANVTLPTGEPTDNCSGVSQEYSPGSGEFMIGETLVMATATDAANNIHSCHFNVIVVDNENPVADCPDDISVDADAGTCGANVTLPTGSPSDNCSGVMQVYSPASGNFSAGITEVTVTATDASSNTHECTFNVTVTDNEDPTFDNPPADEDIDVSSEGIVCPWPDASISLLDADNSYDVPVIPGASFTVHGASFTAPAVSTFSDNCDTDLLLFAYDLELESADGAGSTSPCLRTIKNSLADRR